MRACLLFIFISFLSLGASEHIPALLSCVEGVPEGMIAHHVDAISGQYVDVEVDLYLPGPNPLVLQRNYESGDFATGQDAGQWRIMPHCFLVAGEDEEGKAHLLKLAKYLRHQEYFRSHVYIGEPLGSFLCYTGWKEVHTKNPFSLTLCDEGHLLGVTNCSRGLISGQTSHHNTKVHYAPYRDRYEVSSGDGRIRIYCPGPPPTHPIFAPKLLQRFASFLQNPCFYQLQEERLPSGNYIRYFYNCFGNLTSVELYGEGEEFPTLQLRFFYSKNDCRIKGSDGRVVAYRFSPTGDLVGVERSHQGDLSYSYDPSHHRLILRERPDGSFLQITYDAERRVHSLSGPEGEEASFTYQPQATLLSLPSGTEKKYAFSKEKRLISISTYPPDGTLHLREYWDWERGGKEKEGRLRSKSLGEGDSWIHRCQLYLYDQAGNPLEECLYGNLTGRPQELIRCRLDGRPSLAGVECHRKVYTYSSNSCNLLTSQTDEKGSQVLYLYKPKTNLLTEKYILEKGGKARKRYFYTYDQRALQQTVIEDDGSEQDPAPMSLVATSPASPIANRGGSPPFAGVLFSPESMSGKLLSALPLKPLISRGT